VRHVRSVPGVVVVLGAVLLTASCVPPAGTGTLDTANTSQGRTPVHPSVDAARELDQEGVRSFRAGRYNDAVVYFRAAYQLGGPSSELWNIVRCRERMDDAEGAAAAIDDYLAAPDVLAQDRADAGREAQALRSRSSSLTVTTTPPGASVSVDGKPAPGSTPLSVDVRAGSHTIAVQRAGYSPREQAVEARFGRAVIVTLDLDRAPK
jgi:PEGA domain